VGTTGRQRIVKKISRGNFAFLKKTRSPHSTGQQNMKFKTKKKKFHSKNRALKRKQFRAILQLSAGVEGDKDGKRIGERAYLKKMRVENDRSLGRSKAAGKGFTAGRRQSGVIGGQNGEERCLFDCAS